MDFRSSTGKFSIGNKIKNLIPLIIISILPFLFELNCTNPTSPPPTKEEPPKAIKLNLLDVSCTEAFIKVTASDTVLPANITLNKDESALFNFTLTKTDTVVIDTTLEPGKSYTYQTETQINGTTEKSDTLQVKSLNITSNNFTWQTYTFGDINAGSSGLSDVAIIDENNIWAVGEINVSDSSGNGYTTYNAVHWDGSKWELKRIPFLYNGQNFYGPINSIFAFSKEDIWFGIGNMIHWNGQKYISIQLPSNAWGPYRILKIWGKSGNDFYIVGESGNIAHYQNGKWNKVESGTTTNINDIWGYYEPTTGKGSILCVATNLWHEGEHRLLSISEHTAADTLNWPYTNLWLKGVWFKNQYSPVYICGEGVSMYKNTKWSKINLPNYFTEAIRGDNYNNIFVVGDFGMAAHFNGMRWQSLDELFGKGKFLSVSVKGNTVAICGEIASGGIVGSSVVIIGQK